MTDSPAFTVLHYYRDKIRTDEDGGSGSSGGSSTSTSSSSSTVNGGRDDQEEREKVIQPPPPPPPKNRQYYQYPQQPATTSSPSTQQFTIHRSFVTHPSFKYMSTTPSRNHHNEEILDAVLERIDKATAVATTATSTTDAPTTKVMERIDMATANTITKNKKVQKKVISRQPFEQASI
jgi:arylsulfatase A-like enzyme